MDIHIYFWYSHISVAQSHEYEYRSPPGKPCIWHRSVHVEGWCVHTTGYIWIEYRILFFVPRFQHVGLHLACRCFVLSFYRRSARHVDHDEAPRRKLFLTYTSPVHYNAVQRADTASLQAAEPWNFDIYFIYISMYLYMYIYIHIYLYICVCVYT